MLAFNNFPSKVPFTFSIKLSSFELHPIILHHQSAIKYIVIRRHPCHFLLLIRITLPFTHSQFDYLNIEQIITTDRLASQFYCSSKNLFPISVINFWGHTQILSSIITKIMPKSTFQEHHSLFWHMSSTQVDPNIRLLYLVSFQSWKQIM